MSLDSALQNAVTAGTLLSDAHNNIQALLASSQNPIYRASIEELVQGGHGVSRLRVQRDQQQALALGRHARKAARHLLGPMLQAAGNQPSRKGRRWQRGAGPWRRGGGLPGAGDHGPGWPGRRNPGAATRERPRAPGEPLTQGRIKGL